MSWGCCEKEEWREERGDPNKLFPLVGDRIVVVLLLLLLLLLNVVVKHVGERLSVKRLIVRCSWVLAGTSVDWVGGWLWNFLLYSDV